MRRASILMLPALAIALLGATPFPETIDFPADIAGEGVAVGTASTFYAGSLATGAVFRGDLREGTVESWIDDPAVAPAAGLGVDEARSLLFVAGGGSGQAAAYDTASGEAVAVYTLTSEPSFINDVIVTREAAWFTNSSAAELYRVPIGPGGELGAPTTLPLSGPAAELADGFNLNGIEATADGKTLIVVNTVTGKLFTVDPSTGSSAEIDLGGDTVASGDGILLAGHTLYVLQNGTFPGIPNQVAVVALSGDLGEGEVVRTITHPAFETATTLARFGDRLVAVNAQFAGAPVDPETEVVVFPRR